MLVSLVIHHAKNRKLEIYVIASDLPDTDRQKIEASLCENRSDFELTSLHWLSPNMDMFQDLHVSRYITLSSYLRLLAPSVLPEDFDRVLYLDSDMVILSDLSALYDSLFNDNAILAARDFHIGIVSAPDGVFNYAELGIPAENHYFNAGVLLINLRRWREEKIADCILRYLNLHKASVHFYDQGGMNAILHNSWTEIDPAWNQTRGILFPEIWKKLGYSTAEWKRAKNHPRIVHFDGPAKPWLPGIRWPDYSHFFTYLDRTAYRNAFRGPRLERLVGRKVYFFLWRAVQKFRVFLKRLKRGV